MPTHLVAVANATASQAQLTSTYSEHDACTIPAGQVAHTGGKDGDYIQVPFCSGSQYYRDHHILIKASTWTLALWSNDDSSPPNQVMWSPGDFYSEANPIPGSAEWENIAILITTGPDSQPKLACAQWTGST